MTDFSAFPDPRPIDTPLWDLVSGDLPLRDPTAGDSSEPESEPIESGVYDSAALAAAIPVDTPPVWDENEHLSVPERSVPGASRTAPSAYEQATFSPPG